MDILTAINLLNKKYTGLNTINTWGETSLFYNPDNLLKRGTYFLTFKERDGENDASSKLNRDIVDFRMNFKISKTTFLKEFNQSTLPKRPSKGHVINLSDSRAYDPTEINRLFPHPVYGWMSWVSIINPTKESFNQLIKNGLIDEAFDDAIQRYQKSLTKLKNT